MRWSRGRSRDKEGNVYKGSVSEALELSFLYLQNKYSLAQTKQFIKVHLKKESIMYHIHSCTLRLLRSSDYP